MAQLNALPFVENGTFIRANTTCYTHFYAWRPMAATLYCSVGNLEIVGRLRFFLLNHIDYVSLNSNPWDGNAPSLGNSWEPRKSILVNYQICSSLHYIMLGKFFCMYTHALRNEEFNGTVYNNVRLCSRDQNSK